jgi:hypothetical protein
MCARAPSSSLKSARWRDRHHPGVADGSLYDNRQFVFAIGSDSRVYANWQTTPNGGFQGWTDFFGTDPMTSGVVDVASDTPTPRTVGPMYQYLLRSNGAVVMRRKTGGWAGPWDPWSSIATVPGLTRVTAAMTEDYPVLVLADATNVYVTWGQPGGSNWVSPQWFSDGLPASRCLTDVEMGKTVTGELDVFLLLREQCDPNRVAIYRRTKQNASAGSAWGNWTRYRATAPAFPGGPNDLVSSSELIGATALALLPPRAARGDGLLVISQGAIYESAWRNASPAPHFLGWLPFYGPVRPWEGIHF